MATIKQKQTKNGISYKITVSNGYDIAGKQIREVTTYTPDKTLTPKQQEKALQAFVFEFEQRVKQGRYLNGDKITFKDFTNKWLLEYGKTQLAVTTYDSYYTSLNKHILPLIGHFKLSQIKPLHLQSIYNQWLNEGLQPATIKKRHSIIRVILKTAIQWQIIDHNPCERVQLPKANKDISDIKYFTPQQANIFIEAINNSDLSSQLKLFYTLAIYTGLRRGELIALTWDDIDYTNNLINVNKSTTVATNGVINKGTKNKSSVRYVSIPPTLTSLIKAYKREQMELQLRLGNLWEGDNHIFIQWNGKQMYPDTVSHTFRDFLLKHNEAVKDNPNYLLPIIPLHGLRHTNATLLISSNKIDIKTIQAHLGHANTNTTLNIYAHPLAELEKNCAAALDNIINIAK